MSDYATLRQMAQSMPSVTLDSAALLELLDAAESITVVLPKEKPKRKRPEVDPEDERCARWLFDVLRRTAPKAKEPNFATWANDIRLMREQDDRSHKEICELFRWSHKDPFWCTNILSPKALREQWDRLALQCERGPKAQLRETVDDRNARLQAEFLGAPAVPERRSTYLQLEA